MPDSLTPDWSGEYQTLRNRLDARFAVIRDTPVVVLVWGPGEHSDYYPKREAICGNLREDNPKNEVATSEFLIRTDRRFSQLHPYEAEELQLDAADLAIVIVSPDHRATGARMEVGMFGLFGEFRQKLYLVLPRGFAESTSGFLDRGLDRIAPERRFEYELSELQDCTRIRGFCRDAVKRVRDEIGFHSLRRDRR